MNMDERESQLSAELSVMAYIGAVTWYKMYVADCTMYNVYTAPVYIHRGEATQMEETGWAYIYIYIYIHTSIHLNNVNESNLLFACAFIYLYLKM